MAGGLTTVTGPGEVHESHSTPQTAPAPQRLRIRPRRAALRSSSARPAAGPPLGTASGAGCSCMGRICATNLAYVNDAGKRFTATRCQTIVALPTDSLGSPRPKRYEPHRQGPEVGGWSRVGANRRSVPSQIQDPGCTAPPAGNRRPLWTPARGGTSAAHLSSMPEPYPANPERPAGTCPHPYPLQEPGAPLRFGMKWAQVMSH